jgi:hypothetical protein
MSDLTAGKAIPGRELDRMVVLSDGPFGTVTQRLYRALQYRLQARLAVLPSGEVCSAESLLGVEYWRALSRADRCCAGRCIAHFAALGMYPIRVHSASQAGRKYYQLP